MTPPRAFFGARVADVADLDGLHAAQCVECGRWVMVEATLVGDDLALCARPCGVVACFRAAAWLWVNPAHHELSRRLVLPLRDAVEELPPELAALANPERRNAAN